MNFSKNTLIVLLPLISYILCNTNTFESWNGPSSELFLVEQFDGKSPLEWKNSLADSPQNSEPFFDEWSISSAKEGTLKPLIEGDEGLILPREEKSKHYSVSAKLPKKYVFGRSEKPFVLQFEVKVQEGLRCGGAYMKLYTGDDFDPEEVTGSSPYSLMFGPDFCGKHVDKVHLIMKHDTMNDGNFIEKAIKKSPKTALSFGVEGVAGHPVTSLYTLVIKDNGDYSVIVNGGEESVSGNLLDDLKPGFLELDKKPEDWDSRPMIPDLSQTKPADWNDVAFIINPDITKPDDWDVELDKLVYDPSDVKPEEWDDIEDGQWIQNRMPNPACEGLSGCGPWEHQLMANPDFSGSWKQPMMKNPNYRGVWESTITRDPEVIAHPRESILPITGIGFEVWTGQGGVLFDNIVIGESEEEILQFTKDTWKIKYDKEVEIVRLVEEEKGRKKLEEAQKSYRNSRLNKGKTAAKMDSDENESLYWIVKEGVAFVSMMKKDPISTFKEYPMISFNFVFLNVLLGFLSVIGVRALFGKKKAANKTSGLNEKESKKSSFKEGLELADDEASAESEVDNDDNLALRVSPIRTSGTATRRSLRTASK